MQRSVARLPQCDSCFVCCHLIPVIEFSKEKNSLLPLPHEPVRNQYRIKTHEVKVNTAGNSGGALLDEKGDLIGITSFRTKDNQGNVVHGLVYSIPINTIINYLR